MSRVTYKQLQQWIDQHNENNVHKVELSAFNDMYWIYDAETRNRIVCDDTPGRTWELFYAWRDGYRTALDDVRRGIIDPNK